MAAATPHQLKLTPSSLVERIRSHGWNPTLCGVIVGLCGGVIVPLIGSALTAISWFTGAIWHGWHMQRDGTVLLFLTIPLLLLGAHCLDLIEQQHKRSNVSGPNLQSNAFEEERNN